MCVVSRLEKPIADATPALFLVVSVLCPRRLSMWGATWRSAYHVVLLSRCRNGML
jgi:hypothetical protein